MPKKPKRPRDSNQLAALESQIPADGEKARRKKGENLQAIRDALSGGRPRSASELAEEIGIAPSSVQAVLRKNPADFKQDSSGLWLKKGGEA